MSISSRLLLALAASSSLACSFAVGVASTGFCMQSTLLDLRIGAKWCEAGSVSLDHAKERASPEAIAAAEKVLPAMVDAAVAAALQCVGVGAGGKLVEEACDIAEAVKPAVKEAVRENKDPAAGAASDRKTKRRKKKAAARPEPAPE